jgi:hypothetical protein
MTGSVRRMHSNRWWHWRRIAWRLSIVPYIPAWGAGWRRARRVSAVLATSVVLPFGVPALHPAPAEASTYDVFTCSQPNGSAAPADGWSSYSNNANMVVENNCAQAGYLTAGMFGRVPVPVGAEAAWTFLPPEGTFIKQATIHREYENGDWQDTGYATAFESLEAPYRGSRAFDTCVHSAPCSGTGLFMGRFSANNFVSVPAHLLEPEPGGPVAGIAMVAGCTTTLPGGYYCEGAQSPLATFAGINTAVITLEDDSTPDVAVVGGSLTTGNNLGGSQSLALTGSDTGSGIYQAVLEADGRAVQTSTVDNNGGHCQDVGQTTDGRPGFLYVEPCKLQINNQYVTFDLSGIADGPHRISVLVTDAAGNGTTLLGRNVVIGRGACNGTCDDQSRIVPANRRLLKPMRRSYRRSGFTLAGKLVDHAGAPVTGARVELLQQASYTGARLVSIANVTTEAGGQWNFRVPRGPSRLLRVAFRSHALDAGYATSLDYHQRVAADLALRARRRVRVGAPFSFRGALVGGYIPLERNIIQMEIFFAGRWRTIETFRTDRYGRFDYRYTFGSGAGSSYLFRATVPYSRTYPFLASSSRSVRVSVST